jgi:hypothetical protein
MTWNKDALPILQKNVRDGYKHTISTSHVRCLFASAHLLLLLLLILGAGVACAHAPDRQR